MERMSNLYPMIVPPKPEIFHCPSCTPSKSTYSVPPPAQQRAPKPFELPHSDLPGKFSTTSLGRNQSYIVLIDNFSHFAWVYFLKKKKSDTTKAIKDMLKQIQTQYNTTVKALRTDNGGEYLNSEVESLLADRGIVLQKSPPYEHESNRLAERFNRTIVTIVHTMLMDNPKFLWREAIAYATYLYNCISHHGIENKFLVQILDSIGPLTCSPPLSFRL
jgi:transposase InsO family protein